MWPKAAPGQAMPMCMAAAFKAIGEALFCRWHPIGVDVQALATYLDTLAPEQMGTAGQIASKKSQTHAATLLGGYRHW